MSRTLTTSMRDALVADTVRPIYLVRMEFDSSESPAELNLWSGVGDLSYGGETYLGVGDLLGISEIKESGYRIIINCGPDSNQEVPHLHAHILGGKNLGSLLG